jgi:hypothetical protein
MYHLNSRPVPLAGRINLDATQENPLLCSFPMRKLTPLLAALTLCAAAHAQDTPANAGELRLNPAIPVAGGGRVQTDLVPHSPSSAPSVAAAASAPPISAIGAGVPRIPGAGDPPTPGATPPAEEPLTKNFVPGEPVPTYATLEAAAAAGVEPLPALQPEAPEPPPGAEPLAKSFNWKSPQAYLQWLHANTSDAMLYGGGGLFVLLAAGWIALRRGLGRG